MFFTRFFVSALCVGAGIAANPRAVSTRNTDSTLTALQSLQNDVNTYGAIIKENVGYTSILNENATAITAIQGALSSIADSISQTTQSIQSAPADKRQASGNSTDPAASIEYLVQDIAFALIGIVLSLVGTITSSQAWQNVYNPLLQGFTELTTVLGGLLGNIPGFSALASALQSAFNSLGL